MADGIQFNDEQESQFNPARFTIGSTENPSRFSLMYLIQKVGIAHSQTQAQYILLAVGITTIALTAFIIAHNILGVGSDKGKIKYNIPKELISKYPPDIQQKLMAAEQQN